MKKLFSVIAILSFTACYQQGETPEGENTKNAKQKGVLATPFSPLPVTTAIIPPTYYKEILVTCTNPTGRLYPAYSSGALVRDKNPRVIKDIRNFLGNAKAIAVNGTTAASKLLAAMRQRAKEFTTLADGRIAVAGSLKYKFTSGKTDWMRAKLANPSLFYYDNGYGIFATDCGSSTKSVSSKTTYISKPPQPGNVGSNQYKPLDLLKSQSSPSVFAQVMMTLSKKSLFAGFGTGTVDDTTKEGRAFPSGNNPRWYGCDPTIKYTIGGTDSDRLAGATSDGMYSPTGNLSAQTLSGGGAYACVDGEGSWFANATEADWFGAYGMPL
jgi:hypothetical protein